MGAFCDIHSVPIALQALRMSETWQPAGFPAVNHIGGGLGLAFRFWCCRLLHKPLFIPSDPVNIGVSAASAAWASSNWPTFETCSLQCCIQALQKLKRRRTPQGAATSRLRSWNVLPSSTYRRLCSSPFKLMGMYWKWSQRFYQPFRWPLDSWGLWKHSRRILNNIFSKVSPGNWPSASFWPLISYYVHQPIAWCYQKRHGPWGFQSSCCSQCCPGSFATRLWAEVVLAVFVWHFL